MAVTVAQRWVVEGGSLLTPWVPSRLVNCGGRVFLELKTADRKLASLLGLQGGHEQRFTSVVRQLRNHAVDDVILASMRVNDPLGQFDHVTKEDRASFPADALPDTVTIELPEVTYNGEVGGACTMTCLAEIARFKCAAIELTSDNLHYVRVATLALAGEHTDELHFAPNLSTRKKRPAESKVVISSKFVKADYRRKSLYTRWTDPDGRVKRHYHQPTAWGPDEIAQAEQDLVEWKNMNDNGVGEVGADANADG